MNVQHCLLPRAWLLLVLLGPAACGERGHGFKIAQRSTLPVPGFEGQVFVEVDDIKRGSRADVRITTADGQELASGNALRRGQSLRFKVDGKTYTLRVDRYEDHSFSDDFAHLSVHGLSDEQVANLKKKPPPTHQPPPTSPLPPPAQVSVETVSVSHGEMGVAVPPAPLDEKGESCGTARPTVQERIADCEKKSRAKSSIRHGTTDGGSSVWRLATRTSSGREVWFHVPSGQLWSDRLGGDVDLVSLCRAKGVIGKTLVADCTPERGPVSADMPSFALGQVHPAESWCSEQERFVTPTRFDEAKGGMRRTATKHSPSVIWALPSGEEWSRAKADGAERVLPHGTDPMFWTTSAIKQGLAALAFRALGARADLSPEQARHANKVGPVLRVRCVGTPAPAG